MVASGGIVSFVVVVVALKLPPRLEAEEEDGRGAALVLQGLHTD